MMPCPVLSFFPSSDRASAVRSAAFETSSKLPVRGKPLMCTTAFFKLNAVVDIVLPCPVFHGRTESEMRIGRRQSGDAEDGLQLIQLSRDRTQHSSPFRFCFFRCGAFSSPAEQASALTGRATPKSNHKPLTALADQRRRESQVHRCEEALSGTSRQKSASTRSLGFWASNSPRG